MYTTVFYSLFVTAAVNSLSLIGTIQVYIDTKYKICTYIVLYIIYHIILSLITLVYPTCAIFNFIPPVLASTASCLLIIVLWYRYIISSYKRSYKLVYILILVSIILCLWYRRINPYLYLTTIFHSINSTRILAKEQSSFLSCNV